MNYQRYFALLIVAILSTPAQAECFRLNRNSCWDITNRSLSDIVISCRDDHTDLFGERVIYSGATVEQQFPEGYNEGRGAFGADFPIRCKIEFEDGAIMPIRFLMVGSGDRVEIRVDEQGADVTVRSYWTRGLGRSYSFKRK